MAPKDKKVLALKEASILRRAIQSYDSGKYKIALKDAEQILKKSPDHGETLAIKGLCLAQLEKRKEAVEVARKGLLQDLTSFLCWHALAICQRKDRNYEEALKAYMQAARLEPGNVNMYREIALMHVMLRQHGPVIEQRLKVLKMQPHIRLNWTQLAVSHHLAGNLDEAVRVLDSYQETIKAKPEKSYEHSETILYQATILEEAGRYKEALDKLEQNEKFITDLKAKDIQRAQCYLALKNYEQATIIYRDLLEKNPNEQSYLEGYLAANGVSLTKAGKASEDSTASKALVVLEDLEQNLPGSRSVTRAALVLLHGEEFEKRLRAYILKSCQKGVPSLFSSIKSLYHDDKKRAVIEHVAEAFREAWEPKEGKEEEEPPSTYLWCLYFLAQHYTYTGQQERALAYIDSAIAHSPTMPELHMTRARILKRAGDLLGAAHAAQDARLLDGQDRYLNCKAAKYALRIDDVEGASAIAGLFTKPDGPTPVNDLLDMQAFWYVIEDADAYFRLENWSLALKRYSQIDSIIEDMWHDQLDFHGYCMRKYTFRNYIRSVRWEDQIRTHPALLRAQLQTVKLCTMVHDNPALKKSGPKANKQAVFQALEEAKKATAAEAAPKANGNATTNGKAAAETPKSNKSKKAAAAEAAKKAAAEKAANEAAEKAAASKNKKKDDDDDLPAPPKDEDPEGVQLLADLVPLELARSVCQSLQRYVPDKAETWLATFEWAIREKNWLSCVRAVTHAHAIDPSHPDLHVAIIRLKQSLPSLDGAPEPVRDSIAPALETVLAKDQSLESFRAAFLQRNSESAAHVLGAAKALLELGSSSDALRKREAVELILRIPKLSSATLQDAIAGQEVLGRIAESAEVVSEYDQLAGARWTRANAFKSVAQLVKEAEQRETLRRRWEAVKDEELEGAPIDATL